MLEGSKAAQVTREHLSTDGSMLSPRTTPSTLRDRTVSVDRRLVMSTPGHGENDENNDNTDKLATSIPPEIADPQEQNEVRRIQERIAALTQRHETSMPLPQRRPPSLDQHADIEAEVATSPSGEHAAEPKELPRGAWMRTLEPVIMPPPPLEMRSLLSYSTFAGAIAAICVAAGIALAVTNSLRPPTADAAVFSGTDPGQSRSLSNTVLADLTQIPPAEARVQPAEPSPAPALSVFARLQNTDPAPARSPVVLPPVQIGIAAPPPDAVPEPRETLTLSPDEVSAMLRRGRDLITAGDLTSARLILQRVAEAGSAEASLALARTFDPVMLAKLGVIGARPDPAKARAWYARAADQGSPEAQQRLQQ
jgi:hypothetical protein